MPPQRGVCDGELGAEGGGRSILQGQSVFSDFVGITTKYSNMCASLKNAYIQKTATKESSLCRERYRGILCILFRLQLQSDDIMIMQLDKERPTNLSPHVTLFVHYHIPQVNTIIPLIFPRISSLIKLPHHIINIINIILLSHRTSECHYSSYFPLSHKYW